MAPPTKQASNSQKAALRGFFDQKRKALSPNDRAHKASQLLQWIHVIPAFAQAKHIAFYWPMGAEISPLPLLFAAEQQEKHCYLPCIRPGSAILDFVTYRSQDTLIKNPFGFLEPDPQRHPGIALCDLDLIVVPLLAFDSHGQRLGRGAGHYDRTLAAACKGDHRPYLLGLGYACQFIDELPTDLWDRPMDAILTEEGHTIF